MVGAHIYATVGSQDKIDHLVDSFGIPRENIFNSRDSSFLLAVMQATGGRGVDVALNSLSGELLHATVSGANWTIYMRGLTDVR
jgi:NADPH:quinone reductase-like Zn-dependent oxidoreductase